MRVLVRALCTTTAVAGAIVGSAIAYADDDIDNLLADGKFTFDARLRYEHIEQANKALDAQAPTVRVRIGFVTGKFENFQALIEGEAVGHLSEKFDDTVNGNTSYPIVADPEGIELNRLQLDYAGIPQTLIRVGRQRVNLDNQRFVGAVGWRQNEQTFDAAMISNTSIENLTLTYAYVDQVNRVFGHDSSVGEIEGSTHLFNAAYDWAPVGKIVGYAYLIDADKPAALNAASNATFGLRIAGRRDVADGFKVGYEAEYAHQNDYGSATANFDLNYWHADLSLIAGPYSVLGGFESLEGDGTTGFTTPLATLHKFQGYADVFLTTPTNGIDDYYGKLGYDRKLDEPVGPITGFSAAVWYHDFESENTSASLGDEWDVEALARLGEHYAFGAKYANYDGASGNASRDKVWIYLDVNY